MKINQTGKYKNLFTLLSTLGILFELFSCTERVSDSLFGKVQAYTDPLLPDKLIWRENYVTIGDISPG